MNFLMFMMLVVIAAWALYGSYLAIEKKDLNLFWTGAAFGGKLFANFYAVCAFTAFGIISYVVPTGSHNEWFMISAVICLVMWVFDRQIMDHNRRQARGWFGW